MKRLAWFLLAATVPAPALAQHEGHVEATDASADEQGQPADPHAGHSMTPAPVPTPAPDPHAGHVMPAPADEAADAAPDPHAGHVMPSDAPPADAAVPESDEHAAHGAGAPTASTGPLPPAAPPPAAALSGPEDAADLFFPAGEMAAARAALLDEHGDLPVHRVLIDQLEARLGDGPDGYEWDVQAWYGGDIDKFWFKSEGDGELWNAPDQAEVQALWSRAIDPWFDVQLGVRQDFLRGGPDRTYLVAGVQGLAPYWFEVEATTFLSNKGEVMARVEGEYDLRLAQALILQPRLEADFALQNSPELRVGAGLSTGQIGARLRYELFPAGGPAVIAPYIGLSYERAFGRTARYYRAAGDDVGGWDLLVGVRTWF